MDVVKALVSENFKLLEKYFPKEASDERGQTQNIHLVFPQEGWTGAGILAVDWNHWFLLCSGWLD